MVRTWCEPSQNHSVLEDFGFEDSEDLPCFVAFIWDDNDELHQITVPIIGRNVDECYNSIEEIVKTIARAENTVAPQYRRSVNLFREVEADLEALKFRVKWKSRGKIAIKFAEFFATFL